MKVAFHLEKEPFTEGTDKRQHNQWYSSTMRHVETCVHSLSQRDFPPASRFHFKLGNVKDTPCELSLSKLEETSYAAMWQGYWATASTDGKTWFRCVAQAHYTRSYATLTP